MGIIFGAHYIYQSNVILTHELEKRGESIAYNLAYNAKYGTLTNNRAILNQILAGTLQEADASSAVIYNVDGYIIADKHRDSEQISLFTQDQLKDMIFLHGHYDTFNYETTPPLYNIVVPIRTFKLENTTTPLTSEDRLLKMEEEEFALLETKGEATTIGYAQVTLSLRKLIQEQNNIIYAGFLITLLIIGIMVVPSFVFVRNIIEPINNMTRTAISISEGNLSLRVKKYSSDEIGILGNCFNIMVDSLDKRNTELSAANKSLQKEIKERKQIESKLRQTLMELARSNKELQQFAYVASHDLQEPLRKMRSYSEMLEKRYQGQLDEKADKFIGYIVDGANRMQTLINDLLSYSRVGRMEIFLEETNFETILNQVIVDFEKSIQETEAVITYDPLPTITANSSQISQLLQNLIGNALKFRGKEPPVIHVSAKKTETEWLFFVRDNGIGIEPEYAERIFIIFQRLHSRTEYPGTGVGLAICQRIIERHGGKIWVESELGKGATFYFTIPT